MTTMSPVLRAATEAVRAIEVRLGNLRDARNLADSSVKKLAVDPEDGTASSAGFAYLALLDGEISDAEDALAVADRVAKAVYEAQEGTP